MRHQPKFEPSRRHGIAKMETNIEFFSTFSEIGVELFRFFGIFFNRKFVHVLFRDLVYT